MHFQSPRFQRMVDNRPRVIRCHKPLHIYVSNTADSGDDSTDIQKPTVKLSQRLRFYKGSITACKAMTLRTAAVTALAVKVAPVMVAISPFCDKSRSSFRFSN
jgi:hypothetical protein